MRIKKDTNSMRTLTIYESGKCKLKVWEWNGDHSKYSVSFDFVHADQPLLAPEILVTDGNISWVFSRVFVLNDSDVKQLMDNICEIQNFLKELKDNSIIAKTPD